MRIRYAQLRYALKGVTGMLASTRLTAIDEETGAKRVESMSLDTNLRALVIKVAARPDTIMVPLEGVEFYVVDEEPVAKVLPKGAKALERLEAQKPA